MIARFDPPELWGGIECTCNRVYDRYFDQMAMSGHAGRLDDFELVAGLGIKRLRRGLLWEQYEQEQAWGSFDSAMERMTEVGIQPIAGLLHHGSGPRHTSLLDPAFPRKLAAYAGAVAARYPCIDSYTPVNEPHTTARFSCLYGIWFPHRMWTQSYLRALLMQLKGTVLSMKAIREVRSDARLVQTEDIGKTFSSPELTSLCDLWNERRWLGLDLLCGRVQRGHPLFAYLLHHGIGEQEILWFHEHPCPPDVIGINYYPTSDRYLDHRVELFPGDRVSAEGKFVDVEAVRVWDDGISGFAGLLLDAWDRYQIPMAISEVHLGGPVDEQIRWAVEAWDAARQVRRMGVDCVAVTFWAMLGSFFWDTLVTRDNGHYQPGVFDVSSGRPSRTELADLVQQLANGGDPQHAALKRLGWWRAADRICFWPELSEFVERQGVAC